MSKIKIYCNSCTNSTWHEISCEENIEREDDFLGLPEKLNAQILRCKGCDKLSFRLITNTTDIDGGFDAVNEIYPIRSNTKRSRKYLFTLPKEIKTLYFETITAYDNKLFLLTTVGMRALIESIVEYNIETSNPSQNLKAKIDSLSKYFGEEVTTTLQEFRVMGNKAIHAQISPKKLEIHHALSTIESILEFFYGVKESADRFKRSREKRPNN